MAHAATAATPLVKFQGFTCQVSFQQYTRPRRVALRLLDANSGGCVAMATVNVPTLSLGEREVVIKDYEENAGMLKALIDAGIVEQTGREVSVGYVKAPICRLLVSPN